jgi:TolB-like protein
MTEPRPQIPGYQRFFAELKRRRVFRVMAVYGATGFVVLQVADLLAEGLALPDVVLRTATFLVLIGFPIAVVLAWAFEVTPEGVRKTEDAEPGEITQIIEAPRSARWPAGVLALIGIVALVWGAWYVGKRAGTSGANANAAAESVARPAAIGSGAAVGATSAAEDDGRRAIAVLPFDNMSGDVETEPFVVGVHDDLLTQLSKINALKVTSRTSVKEYRDTEKSIPEIAAELGVETVLEGGVQRAGNQVRINVQLIDPATDEHLWAETYDAELTAENVFAIQSQIARSVADALEAELSPGEREELEVVATRNLDALAAYHAGRVAWEDRGVGTQDSLALAGFERAVQLDPEFADAWAGVSMILSWNAQTRADVDLERARAAISRAEALAPGSATAHLARGYYAYYVDRRFDDALEQFRTADRLRPSDAGVKAAIAYILRRQGDFEGAAEEFARAIELDPRNTGLYISQAETFAALRRWKAREAAVERGLVFAPRNTRLIADKIGALVSLDRDLGRATRYASEVGVAMPADFDLNSARAGLEWAAGNGVRALELLDEAPRVSENQEARYWLGSGLIHRLDGDIEASRAAGERLERLALRLTERDGVRGALLALARGLQWDSAGARALAAEAVKRSGESGDMMLGPRVRATSAEAYVMVGDHASAASVLRDLAGQPGEFINVADLELSPVFDEFRASPRYPEVLAAFEAAEAEAARIDAEAGL